VGAISVARTALGIGLDEQPRWGFPRSQSPHVQGKNLGDEFCRGARIALGLEAAAEATFLKRATSPISIIAAATVSGGVYRFELWSGTTKLSSVSNTGVMNQSLSLAPGSYHLASTAYNTAGTHVNATRDITVSGSSSASFSLSGSSFVIGWRGGAIHVPITVMPSGGLTGNVALACSVSGPSGAVSVPACTISAQPPAITGSSSVTGYVYVTTQTTTTLGNYTLKVNGSNGSLSSSVTIPFTVN
jgi:hypothetical protein